MVSQREQDWDTPEVRRARIASFFFIKAGVDRLCRRVSRAITRTIPRGRTNKGPEVSLPVRSRCGAAVLIADATTMEPMTQLWNGEIWLESMSVINPDPANPPILNRAWNPDISGRDKARSTSTAWRFMATSKEPRDAPNIISAAPREPGRSTSTRSGRKSDTP